MSRYNTPARSLHHRPDTIEDLSDDPDSYLLNPVEDAGDITEDADYDHDEVAFNLEARQIKRRRLISPDTEYSSTKIEEDDEKEETEKSLLTSADDTLLSSSAPVISSPPAHYQISTPSAPRFLPPPTAKPTIDPTQSAFLKAPKFKASDLEHCQPAADPLPDQFSPHRRGQKYLAGGLAAEVQGWLVEIENRGYEYASNSESDQRGRGMRERKGEYDVRLVIDEHVGGPRAGMVIVRGRQVLAVGIVDEDASEKQSRNMVDHLGVVECVLAGEGIGEGLAKGGEARPGKIVGIKPPTWEIELEGRKLGIAVNWRVLN